MWYKIAEKLSTLQILLGCRGSGKTWTLMNGVKNKKEDVVVLLGHMAEEKWMRSEYQLGSNVKFVSYNGELDKLRGIRSPIVVESTALHFIISDAFKMSEKLRK